ncbi:hypothetical protein [Methylobacterium sp. SI9]|uniref:hypothetical protein n=1 Tax=Methylobacterium guangdongense TaxID=3138811 RepID=UPI00313B39FA
MVTDASADLAVFLLKEAMNRTPTLAAFLIAEGRRLPEDPAEAQREVRQRWPEMSVDERDMAFQMAANVLRRIRDDAVENIARLDALTTDAGRG